MAGLMDDFDNIYGSAVEQPSATEPTAPSGGLEEVVEEYSEDDIDDELAAAERQIAKATYYKAIIRQGIIEEDGTELANEVNAEAKLWARYMTMRLLNRRMPEQASAAVESQFSEAEVHALKRLAAIALSRSGEAPAPAPVVKTIQSAPAPSVKKVASQESRPGARAQAPAKQQPPSSKKPAAKVAPGKKPAPAAKAQPKRPADQPFEAPIKDGELDDENIPSNEVFVDPRDGKKYKFVDNRMYDPDIEGSKPRAKLCVENQAVRGINPLPMPSARAMEAISFQQASETIEAGATAGALPTDNGQAGVAMFGLAAQASLRKE